MSNVVANLETVGCAVHDGAAGNEAVPEPVLEDPSGDFRRHYNRQPFMFAHGLKGNALFELDSLADLCARMPDHRDTYWANGSVAVSDTWETGRAARYSLLETIANIADSNSIVIVKHAEQDPIYGPVLQELLAKFVEFSGEQMRGDVLVGEALILISSPNRLTPYHVDAETNFLVQVTGDKILNVFDPTVCAVLTDQEREEFYRGNHSAAIYRKDHQEDATVYDLRAGYGVHIPYFAPHWVRNGDNLSVALSITYELRSKERLAPVYRMNAQLRRLGLTPTSPGQSAWRDQLKRLAMETAVLVRRRPAPQPAPYPIWTPPAA